MPQCEDNEREQHRNEMTKPEAIQLIESRQLTIAQRFERYLVWLSSGLLTIDDIRGMEGLGRLAQG
jgi:hypothetical protein